MQLCRQGERGLDCETAASPNTKFGSRFTQSRQDLNHTGGNPCRAPPSPELPIIKQHPRDMLEKKLRVAQSCPVASPSFSCVMNNVMVMFNSRDSWDASWVPAPTFLQQWQIGLVHEGQHQPSRRKRRGETPTSCVNWIQTTCRSYKSRLRENFGQQGGRGGGGEARLMVDLGTPKNIPVRWQRRSGVGQRGTTAREQDETGGCRSRCARLGQASRVHPRLAASTLPFPRHVSPRWNPPAEPRRVRVRVCRARWRHTPAHTHTHNTYSMPP